MWTDRKKLFGLGHEGRASTWKQGANCAIDPIEMKAQAGPVRHTRAVRRRGVA